MKDSAERVEKLKRRRRELRRLLAEIGEMRPGSLVKRFRRCGKPGCHCAQPGAAGHGPSWSLTRGVHGKTVTKIIPPGPQVERTRRQIAECRRFRHLAREMIEVSEQLCHAALQGAAPERQKKGSRRSSRPRSRPKSRR